MNQQLGCVFGKWDGKMPAKDWEGIDEQQKFIRKTDTFLFSRSIFIAQETFSGSDGAAVNFCRRGAHSFRIVLDLDLTSIDQKIPLHHAFQSTIVLR